MPPTRDLADEDRASPVHRGHDQADRQRVDRDVAEQELADERREEEEADGGGDASEHDTTEEGQVCVFVAVDHCTSECIGIHASLSGNRFEALEPLRQGVREHFGGFDQGIAAGLAIRHDHGSASMSDDFQQS